MGSIVFFLVKRGLWKGVCSLGVPNWGSSVGVFRLNPFCVKLWFKAVVYSNYYIVLGCMENTI